MLVSLDLSCFAICAALWLGPFAWNACRRRVLLIHPMTAFPFMMVATVLGPLFYRFRGITLLDTSLPYSADPWFLAEPMLILALSGVFYHFGVFARLSSLALRADDDINVLSRLRPIPRAPAWLVAGIAFLVVATAIFLRSLSPARPFQIGGYWLYLLSTTSPILTVLVMCQSRFWGTVFMAATLPTALFVRSKAAFLFFPFTVLLFFQQKVPRAFAVGVVAVCILLTPVAVSRYWQTYVDKRDPIEDISSMRFTEGTSQTWLNVVESMLHREMAFEAFAIVYRREASRPMQLGRNLFTDLLASVPSWLYPDKPQRLGRFEREYLPADVKFFDVFFSSHVLSVLFLDFGLPGCLGGMFLLGYGTAAFYERAKARSLRKGSAMPLLLYFAFALQCKGIAEAGLAGTVANFAAQASALFLVYIPARVSLELLPSKRPVARSVG